MKTTSVAYQFRGDQLTNDAMPIRLLRDLVWEHEVCDRHTSSPTWDIASEYLRQRDRLAKRVAEGSAE